jgi:hypothetical protein
MCKFESSQVSQAVQRSERPSQICAQKPANGGLLPFRVRKTQPYAKKIVHRAIWVEPSLLAEIEYRAKSAEGKLRHPFFKGIRNDL